MTTACRSAPFARTTTLNPPRPGLAAPLAAGASLATALALLALATTMFGPVLALDHADDNAAGANLIRRFYAVANDVLAGGNPDALAAVVAPNLVVHDAARDGDDPAPLAQRLAAMRASSPDARLVADDVIVAGDRAAVQVTMNGTAGIPGLPVAGPPALAAGTELFRFVDGRIAEYWPLDDANRLARALPPVSIGFWNGARHVGVARFDLPGGAAIDDLQGPWPHLLVGAAGSLTVSLQGAASYAPAGQTPAVWKPTAPGGQTIVLRPGDALAIPPGVAHSLRNGGNDPATAFGVLAYSIGDLFGTEYSGTPAVPDLLSIYNGGFIGKRMPRGSGAFTEIVGSESDVTLTPTARTLSLAWLPLSAAQTIPVRRIDGIEGLLPLSGMLLVDRSPQGPILMPGANPRSSALGGPASADRPPTATEQYVPAAMPSMAQRLAGVDPPPAGPAPVVLLAGEAAMFSSGWSAKTTAIGGDAASVLVVRVADMTTVPAGAATPAS